MYDVSFDYDQSDSYHYMSVYFNEPDTTVGYRCQLQYDVDHNTLTDPYWERDWDDGNGWNEIGSVPPPVRAAWDAARWRAETWTRTGADPGNPQQRGRHSLSRGTWRAS
jgi:hypothetical protein